MILTLSVLKSRVSSIAPQGAIHVLTLGARTREMMVMVVEAAVQGQGVGIRGAEGPKNGLLRAPGVLLGILLRSAGN